MRLTTNHSASSYGIPVFVDEDGQVLDYKDGVRRLRRERGWSTADLAERIGTSPRTVEGWEQGRMPNRPALMMMRALLGGTDD
ncbi:helix-turn-helix transcriptional regulator [Pseudodesulfovibrio sp.]|uniref:helix-turn-helix domain-containing protein n=1 Tax=Pseudodesulfovibrio sp. TaxID=2035812 RepID=UPI0026393741|nr:helix-turn-helix transcriptional regulator [Pseudodesulfovibrio sp.]MDD3310974.1 helix-turn-helix transcriptional regulator [Pseudodesulfovibrio sp.]